MKKILPFMLILCMMISTFTFTAFAADTEIIIEGLDSETGFFKTGEWAKSTSTTVVGPQGSYDGCYHYYTDATDAFATYSAAGLSEGTYGVYLYMTNANVSAPEYVDVTVTASGVQNIITVPGKPDEITSKNKWLYLGKFDFVGGSQIEKVKQQINVNGSTGNMRAFAVKFIKNDPTTKTPTYAIKGTVNITSQVSSVKDTDFCTLTPNNSWSMSTSYDTVWGPDGDKYTWNTSDRSAKATFKASHLNGTYGVYTWLSPYPTMAEYMDVTVTASGKPTTIMLDTTVQRDENGIIFGWVYLGNHIFNGNAADSVVHQINSMSVTNGKMRVSAVKYIKDDTNTGDIGNIKETIPEKITLTEGESAILDGNSSGFKKIGSWSESSIYLREGAPTYNSTTKGSYVQWFFDVGNVKNVEVFVPKISNAKGNEDEETTFEIYASGTTHTVTHNFNTGNPGWISLGKYDFTGGGEEYVKIKKTTDSGYTRAIGVMLSLNNPLVNYFPEESYLIENEELHIFERMGMYINDPVTEEYMNSKVTRAEMAVMLTNLFGKADEVEAADATANFNDASGHKYAKTLAWIKAHPEFGIKKQASNSFSPDSYATKLELIKFILQQLGYYEDIDYASSNVKSFAESLKIKTDSDDILTPATMAQILYSAFGVAVNGSEETFFQKMVRENSGITDESLLSRKPFSADMKAERTASKNKDRGIIYNNDGNDVYKGYPEYPGDYPVTDANIATLESGNADEKFLNARTTGLEDTAVSTVYYCTGVVNSYTHISQELEKIKGIDTRRRDWSYLLPEYGYGDTLQIMIDEVRSGNREIFWSMRMNDTHDAGYEESELDSWKQANLDKIVARRLESMFMVAGEHRWSSIDFTYTESRQKIYDILKDTLSTYDLDGLELDFTRHPIYFREVTLGYEVYPENIERMNELVRMIRALTEKYSMERNKPILVSVCLPDSISFCKAVGLDVETWIKEDLVDIASIGWHSCAFQSWEDSIKEYNAITTKYGLDPFPVYAEIDPTAYGDATEEEALNYDYNEALDALNSGAKGIYVYNFFEINDIRFDELHSKEKILASGKIDENYVSKRKTYGGGYAVDSLKFVTLNK